jgi:GH35 family endo-1,4-beta-xylanase
MTNFTELEEYMIEYVTNTVKTVGEYPFAWDAINEAVSDLHNETIKEIHWKNIPDFSCKIFKVARAANGGKQKCSTMTMELFLELVISRTSPIEFMLMSRT